ncbi:ATP-dependent helicase [Hoyosella rhizosphaerae]|uniref:DEAD/DEAH box helicase n=1 Tax=Hoyosella rhizosphaerae TaxID=1755582 RepID=A0A916UCX1_9ACTN|nr:ATP-dependent helicase [Hoyosella rhizosphaerae]MBN4925755.1 ATP-dependent helicase [Hoyosella rhizosphaerae]GGC68214.1 DEAD/DEAH box helicase [Hoyosella rhizosphaerae]
MPALDLFSPATRSWFAASFGAPTPAQEQAWQHISRGEHSLVVAPTGSGKTLAAFLWALDRLATETDPPPGTRIVYISPLKALAVDVERNLRAPLLGISRTAQAEHLSAPTVTVGVRTGDTPSRTRQAMVRNPPDILITTPESLFLMLTSSARDTLTAVHTVIVDEIHSIADSKRGAHLALSLERLDQLAHEHVQRIGLSATVRPHSAVAQYLAGERPVSVIAPQLEKKFDLRVVVPVEDMTNVPATDSESDTDAHNLSANSLWPHVEEQLVDLILQHRSSIVFANSRRLAERLTSRLNEIYSERNGQEIPTGPIRSPAVMIAQGGTAAPASHLLARAHHGSVSKEQRALIEDDLKTGRLRCVVATSSLELGIDMGAVDLVLQVEAPPSVASGLQRVGRAGHQVGETSRGILFPKHRADLLHCAVTVERMRTGQIESLRIPANPLDVLAQQTVAACALEPLDVDAWFTTVRRSGSYNALPRSAFDATLDLLSGKYPSDQFGELRPRIVWDRENHTITGRPGAQRLAVTSGGTIPDRGMYPVFIVGEKSTRVGELDEEMVYESRVGDVFALGATSWRIEDITHDRVLVTPAPGQFGRLPFWIGDNLGRPSELGAALGAFVREIAVDEAGALQRLTDSGLDANAANNTIAFITSQREATQVVPTDTTLLCERFRDELGDWRVILHSPYGLPVHAPWALAISARVRERYGVDGAAVTTDDAIIVRLPDTDADPPGADLFLFDPDEIDALVTAEVGNSSLFAARFRECAARALLLPRRDPGKRSPLWLQRQRSAQLLDVARNYPTFPIVLEAVRECLQDVYDVPGLAQLLRKLNHRNIRIVETETSSPSPFAVSALFGYTGAFVYESDSPLAERKAAALSLDTALLAELLGRLEMRDILDSTVIADYQAHLQWLNRKAVTDEQLVDMLRTIGPLTPADVAERTEGNHKDWLASLQKQNRAIAVTFANKLWWIVVEDAGRMRDAFAAPLPVGVPSAHLEEVPDALTDIVARYARSRGPFTAAEVAEHYALPIGLITAVLRKLVTDRRVIEGEFRPDHATDSGTEWCDTGVLSVLRRKSLAAVRNAIEPVNTTALVRFLPTWHNIGSTTSRGIDGVLTAIDHIAGLPLPASALEPLIFAPRVADYSPAMLDELTTSGEVVWSGAGSLSKKDGWVALHLADTAPLTLAAPITEDLSDTAYRIETVLSNGGGFFFRDLADAVMRSHRESNSPGISSAGIGSALTDGDIIDALWELVWAGSVTNDTFAPVRARLTTGGRTGSPTHRTRQPPPRARTFRAARLPRASLPTRSGPPTVAGRWSLLPRPQDDVTVRAHALCEQLIERYGIVTKNVFAAERTHDVSFTLLYKVFRELEDRGVCRRGYFVTSLGAAQFSTSTVVDRLREVNERPADGVGVVLAAVDPANPYGAALPWPDGPAGGHRAGRKAGALVVVVDGELVAYIERGGKTVLVFGDDPVALDHAVRAVVNYVQRGALDKLLIESINGVGAVEAERSDGAVGFFVRALKENGFTSVPRGFRIWR